ncbi:MAG TPA: TetR/AcrR family transcriptional regulator [Mycobacterium sp.]|nr:TetR/AcrR family transcriptional regulator [Mycobacterium sp.]
MVHMAQTSARPYRGVQPADRRAERRSRLLDAGLTILGSEAGPEALTVRGVCREAGLSARYFYESFSDRDDFVGAIFEWVIADLAATTQAAVAAARMADKARAGMANIVRSIAGDRRVGRLLFSTKLADPVVVRKRGESGALLAMLFGQHVGQALRLPEDDLVRATSHFAVGGVGQTLSAWLGGQISLAPDELVDQLAWFLDRLSGQPNRAGQPRA